MIEVLGGVLMMGGGGLLVVSSMTLVRAQGPSAAEVVAALPFTPLPPPDAELDALVRSIP